MAAPATNPRELRRRQRNELGRSQILDAAEDVFARKGFHDASVKEIASRAEFSVGAVYGLFENKDDLFVTLHERRGGEFMAGMRSLLAEPRPALESLHRLAEFQIGFFREHANWARLILRTSGLVIGDTGSVLDKAAAEKMTEAMTLQADLFRRGQREGAIRAGDPDVLARMYSGLVSSYQATDPVVVSGADPADERMSLAEFHAIVDGAFLAS